MKPLVSILIPAFNAENWIAATLRSAIAQTWTPTEIIVVDDGSTDRTLSIARQFESARVRVLTQENQGAAAARNTAFSYSQGEYIQWLDSDDLLDPSKITEQLQALDRCRNDRTIVSCSWGRFLYRPQRAEFVPTALWRDLSPVEWVIGKMGRNLFMPDHSWLVSRSLTEKAGPWDTTLAVDDDGEYFCRVLLLADNIRFVPEAKVYYRVSGSGSVSNIGLSPRKVDSQWRSMRLQIQYLRSVEDSPRARAACITYLSNWLIYFYPERQDIVSQAEELARELGGELGHPHLSWKYSWIARAFGWTQAKSARLLLPNIRWSVERTWERILSR